MFGDWNWIDKRSALQERQEEQWLASLEKNSAKVVIIEIGAGKAIPSVRAFSHRISREHHCSIIRINPGESQVRYDKDVGIALGAVEGLRGMNRLL